MKCWWGLLLCSQLSWSQYTERFEQETLPLGWTTHVEGAGSWEFGTNLPPFYADPVFVSGAAVFDDAIWGSDARSSTAYLTSPEFVNTNLTNLRLTFAYYLNTYGDWGTLYVQLRLNEESWKTIFVFDSDQVTMHTVEYVQAVKALTKVQVRFVFSDNGGWSWGAAIDDFRLDFFTSALLKNVR